jgi:hypothetical protein
LWSNSYIGIALAEKALQGLPVDIERRPIYIPKERGIKVSRPKSSAIAHRKIPMKLIIVKKNVLLDTFFRKLLEQL